MDSFSNTLNRFKSLNFATVRGAPPDPLRGARDSLLVAKCPPPRTKILPTPLGVYTNSFAHDIITTGSADAEESTAPETA